MAVCPITQEPKFCEELSMSELMPDMPALLCAGIPLKSFSAFYELDKSMFWDCPLPIDNSPVFILLTRAFIL